MTCRAKSAVAFLLLASWHVAALAGDGDNYVSREEYDKLRNELDTLKAEMQALKQQVASRPVDTSQLAAKAELEAVKQQCLADAAEYETWFDTLRKDVVSLRHDVHGNSPGTTKFLLAGDAGMGFTWPKQGDSSFSAGLSPLLLWQINDRLFYEGGLDISLNGPNPDGSGSETQVDLTLSNLSFLVNDWLAVGGGLFTTPFANYHTHLDPRWINKLPDDPLVFGDNGIAPGSEVGIFATGAFPVKSVIVNYSIYAGNGPTLITDDPASAGSLNFDNFNDVNHNKSVGGRIGLVPIPGFEVGYSVQASTVNPDAFQQEVNALLQAVDWNYSREPDRLKGWVTLRGSWVWSNVSEATYDRTGELGFGPLRFDNNRNGGFVEAAYRPTKAKDKYLRNLEFVLRYDRLDVSDLAPGGGLEQRWTPGVDYWLTPSTVLKFGYEINNNRNVPDDNAFVFQFAVGF